MIGWGMDRLRAFEVFATVVGQGSFTRAADKLETSPANVTRYVNELEEALGARLLNRTSRRLSLTETGKTLYDRALSILEDVAEAEAVASSAAIAAARTAAGQRAVELRHSSSGAALAALRARAIRISSWISAWSIGSSISSRRATIWPCASRAADRRPLSAASSRPRAI